MIDDRLLDTAAGVTFWLLLSLPATLLAVLSSVSLLGDGLATDLEQAVFEVVDRTFTDEAEGIRNAIGGLFDQPRAGLFSVSLALALFTVSGGFAGLIRALDVVYDVPETRNFVRLRLAGLGLAIGTLAAVAVSTSLWSWSGELGVPGLVRLAAALAILIAWAATMFHIGPHHHTPWRYDLPGAALAAVGWMVLSLGFGWYVRIAGSGNELVGATGAALLGLTWMWLCCVVLLVGAELNEILADRAGVIGENTPWRHRIARRRRTGERGPDDTAA